MPITQKSQKKGCEKATAKHLLIMCSVYRSRWEIYTHKLRLKHSKLRIAMSDIYSVDVNATSQMP